MTRDRAHPLLAGAGIAAAAIAAYHNSFAGPFVFDDLPAIVDNPTIRQLWNLKAVLSPPPGGYTVSGRPVLNLTLALNYALGGTSVWGYHAVNLLIHICAGLALFGVVRRTLERRGMGFSTGPEPGARVIPARWIAFSTALLWTVHPLQTESVTYIVQRAESLMGLFYLLTLYCFIRYVEGEKAASGRFYVGRRIGVRGRSDGSSRPAAAGEPPPSRRGGAAMASVPPAGGEKAGGGRFYPGLWAGLSIAACLLGMATKEVMVSAPVIVLLYDRTFVSGSCREAWSRRWRYYLGLALTWIPLAWLVLGNNLRGRSAGANAAITPARYWLTQFQAIAHYLSLAFRPKPLVIDYGTRVAPSPGSIWPAIVVVGALAAGSAWLLFRPDPPLAGNSEGRAGGGLKPLGFAGACFFAILAPTSLVPVVVQVMAEHRMYLALAPVATVAVAAGYLLLEKVFHQAGKPAVPAIVPVALVLAAAAALGGATVRRNQDYRSPLILWTKTAAERPDNSRVQNNLGLALADAGDNAEAMEHYRKALKLRPGYPEAHNNLGIALSAAGRWAESIPEYQQAVRLDPAFTKAYYNLGAAFSRTGRPADAIRADGQAVALDPDFAPKVAAELAKNHNDLGTALASSGRVEAALAQFDQAVRLDPAFYPARFNLAHALALTGRIREARAQFEEAARRQEKPSPPAP